MPQEENTHVPAAPGAQPDGRSKAERDGEDARTAAASGAGDAATPDVAGDGHTDSGDGEEGPDLAALQARVQALEDEVAGLRGRLARSLADYDNLQKRMARDAELERERVKARVLEPFLQVYEFSKMAQVEAVRSPGPLAEGVKMMVREFDRMLEAEGLRSVGTVGEPFDPRLHEAVGTEIATDAPEGHVSRVVAPGYRLGERVLRYAKVAVAPAPDDESE